MSTVLQINLAVFSFLFLIFIITQIKKAGFELKYSLMWITFCVFLLIAAIFPSFIELFAGWIGIYSKINAIFLLVIFIQISINFINSINFSRNNLRIVKLTQEIAILHKRIEEIGVKDSSK